MGGTVLAGSWPGLEPGGTDHADHPGATTARWQPAAGGARATVGGPGGASEFWLRNEKIYNINDVNLNDLEVTLYIDNKIMDSGNTKNVLNNPLNAALWLINNLAKKGETLLKGQFISSGSCTKPSKIYSGNHIKARFEQLEDIEFQFI